MTRYLMPSRRRIAEVLTDIRYALDTASVRITKGEGPRRCLLVRLPATLDGSNVCVDWGDQYAIVVADTHVEVTWTVRDRLHGTHTGTVVIDDEHTTLQLGELGTATARVDKFWSGRMLKQQLRSVELQAKESRWKLLMRLEPYVVWLVQDSSIAVAGETGHFTSLSETTSKPSGMLALEEHHVVAAELLLGHEGSAGSATINMLDRLASRQGSLDVDPRAFIARNLRSAAMAAVRRRVGDPKIGPMIRRLASESANVDVHTLVEQLRDRYPKERIGPERVRAALNVATSPHLNALPLQVFDGSDLEDGDDDDGSSIRGSSGRRATVAA